MQEMRVRSLDWEDPLEKEMETHSSILAWGILSTGQPGHRDRRELESFGLGCSDSFVH